MAFWVVRSLGLYHRKEEYGARSQGVAVHATAAGAGPVEVYVGGFHPEGDYEENDESGGEDKFGG